jgi:DNA-directed RNA polymerase specialized sigma subunit
VNFVWISSFTHPLFFCRLNPDPLICQSVEAEAMHSMVERGELAGIADKRGESDLRREEVVSLLAQLPPASRKVLALYYHENMQLLDIAACLGVTESEIREINAQTVASIHLLFAKSPTTL